MSGYRSNDSDELHHALLRASGPPLEQPGEPARVRAAFVSVTTQGELRVLRRTHDQEGRQLVAADRATLCRAFQRATFYERDPVYWDGEPLCLLDQGLVAVTGGIYLPRVWRGDVQGPVTLAYVHRVALLARRWLGWTPLQVEVLDGLGHAWLLDRVADSA